MPLPSSQTNTRYPAWLTALALFAVIAVVMISCSAKLGFHLDEIYSYGLSNSDNGGFLADVAGGSLDDHVFTQEDVAAYLTVSPEQGFTPGAVFANQAEDVHPPLFYLCVHAVSCLFPNTFSKWIGLGLNLLFFAGTLLLLFRMLMTVTESQKTALLGMVLFGMSTCAVSSVLFIRMYALLTFFTVLLAWELMQLLKSEKFLMCPVIGLTLFLGLMTQYFYVWYALVACLSALIVLLKRKNFRLSLVACVCSFVGVGLFLLVWPSVFTHLLGDGTVSGATAASNTMDPSSWKAAFATMTKQALKACPVAAGLGVVALVGAIARSLVSKRAKTSSETAGSPTTSLVLAITIPALIAFALVAIVAPYKDLRYAYNLMPLLVLLSAFLCWKALGENGGAFASGKLLSYGTLCVVLVAMVGSLWVFQPSYLFRNQPAYNQALAPYAEEGAPVVFANDSGNALVTDALLQLGLFDDFLVVKDANFAAVTPYLASHEGCKDLVVFVDKTAWGSDESQQKAFEALGLGKAYTQVKTLYTSDLSDCFVLSAGN